MPAPAPVPEPVPVAPQPVSPTVPVSTPAPQPAAPTPVAAPQPQPVVVPTSAPAAETVPAPVAVPASVVPPQPVPTAMPTVAPAAAPVAANQKPKRILLVEDDDALANVYLMRLEAESFDVYRVANGEDALVSALQYHPDIVLLDVMMPRVSGFEVLDIIRNTPETANLKVIMLTALSQEADKERAQKLGVDDYLVKSQVVIADVIARIKYHLGMV
jgi:CheY-like chemotaxis protein